MASNAQQSSQRSNFLSGLLDLVYWSMCEDFKQNMGFLYSTSQQKIGYMRQVYRDTTVFSKEIHIGLYNKELKAQNDQNEIHLFRQVMTFFQYLVSWMIQLEMLIPEQ